MDISSDEAQVKILGKRLDKTKCVCILRTRIWLENIFYTEKIKRIKLGKVLAKDGELLAPPPIPSPAADTSEPKPVNPPSAAGDAPNAMQRKAKRVLG